MTEKQYEEYCAIKAEVDNLKRFLCMCGKKYYRSDMFDYHYKTRLLGKKRSCAVERKGWGWVHSEAYELPDELQVEIIDVIERYVERKEKEMENI